MSPALIATEVLNGTPVGIQRFFEQTNKVAARYGGKGGLNKLRNPCAFMEWNGVEVNTSLVSPFTYGILLFQIYGRTESSQLEQFVTYCWEENSMIGDRPKARLCRIICADPKRQLPSQSVCLTIPIVVRCRVCMPNPGMEKAAAVRSDGAPEGRAGLLGS